MYICLVVRIEEVNLSTYINSISISLDILLPTATNNYTPLDVEFNYYAIDPTSTAFAVTGSYYKYQQFHYFLREFLLIDNMNTITIPTSCKHELVDS